MSTEGAATRLPVGPAGALPLAALAALTGVSMAALALAVSPLVAGVVGAVAVAAAVILQRPVAGLFVFIGIATLLPFAVFPVRVVFAPTLLDLTLTLLLLGWALPALHRRQRLVVTPLGGALLVFMGLAVVSLVLGSGRAPLSAEALRLFLKLLNSLLLFFAGLQLVRSPATLDRLVATLIGTGTLAAIAALALYVLPREAAVDALTALGPLGYPTGPDVIRTLAETDLVRATGTSVDPNVLGGLLMLVAVLAATELLSPHAVLPRPLLLIALLPLLAALALSYSRSAWVGTAAGLVFLALFRDRRLWLALGAALVALVVAPPGRALLARLVSGFQARDPAAAMRLGEYANALAIIGQYPWFGIGFSADPDLGVGVGVSNVYLLVGEEMGLVGLAVFLAIVGGALHWSLRAPADDGPGDRRRTRQVGLQAALVAALVAGLFDHYFFNLRFPHMVALFWLLVGLLVATTRLGQAPVTRPQRPRPG